MICVSGFWLKTFAATAAGPGEGSGALAVLVGNGVETAGVGGAEGGGPVEIAPSARETRFGGAVFPEKNSPAVNAGSEEGANG